MGTFGIINGRMNATIPMQYVDHVVVLFGSESQEANLVSFKCFDAMRSGEVGIYRRKFIHIPLFPGCVNPVWFYHS